MWSSQVGLVSENCVLSHAGWRGWWDPRREKKIYIICFKVHAVSPNFGVPMPLLIEVGWSSLFRWWMSCIFSWNAIFGAFWFGMLSKLLKLVDTTMGNTHRQSACLLAQVLISSDKPKIHFITFFSKWKQIIIGHAPKYCWNIWKIFMPSGGEMVDDLWCGLGYSHAKKLSLDHLRQLRVNLLQAGFWTIITGRPSKWWTLDPTTPKNFFFFDPHRQHFIHKLWILSMNKTTMPHKHIEKVNVSLLPHRVFHSPLVG